MHTHAPAVLAGIDDDAAEGSAVKEEGILENEFQQTAGAQVCSGELRMRRCDASLLPPVCFQTIKI